MRKYFIIVLLITFTSISMAYALLVPNYYLVSETGAIRGDPEIYQIIAIKKSEQIKKGGIYNFELRPEGQGSSGVASLIYLVTKNHYAIIFMNALLLTITAYFMLKLFLNWFEYKISVIATLPLVLSLYMFVWYSQLNKDSFALAGAVMLIYGVTLLLLNSLDNVKSRALAYFLLVTCVGIFLISIVRPYVNIINIFIVSPILIFMIARMIVKKQAYIRVLVFSVMSLLIVGSLVVGSDGGSSAKTLKNLETYSQANIPDSGKVSVECFRHVAKWRRSDWMPLYLDKKIKSIMVNRCLIFSIISTHKNKATQYSFIDKTIYPGSTVEGLQYLARGFVLGLLSPFPDKWLYNVLYGRSFFYTVVPLETLFLYVCLVALMVWIYRKSAWLLLVPVLLSLLPLTIYGASTPYIGVLYRYRYPWWMFLICLGFAALISLVLESRLYKKRC